MQVYWGSKNIFLAFSRVVTYKVYMHIDTLVLAAVVSRGHTEQFRNTRQTYPAADMMLLLVLSRD